MTDIPETSGYQPYLRNGQCPHNVHEIPLPQPFGWQSSTSVLWGCLHNIRTFLLQYCFNNTADLIYDRSLISWVTIPEAVIIQFVLLKMSMLMLETCRGL